MKRDCSCVKCGKKYEYDSRNRRGHTKSVCNSCMSNGKREKRKRLLVKALGGECSSCGYKRCLAALEFHHVSGNKEFTISGNHCRSLESVLKELEDCIILCSNCHKEVHYGIDGPECEGNCTTVL